MTVRVKLAASILAADFSRLGKQAAEAEQAGVDRIHADVIDAAAAVRRSFRIESDRRP